MKYRERKGVSTFIAVLLLMALAVAAGVVIYSYTMGYLGGLGGTSTPGTMSLDTVSGSDSLDKITAYVRNIGKSSIDFDTGYIDGVQVDPTNFTASPDPLVADGIATVTLGYPLTAGTTYEVKLVAIDNTQLVFSVKAN